MNETRNPSAGCVSQTLSVLRAQRLALSEHHRILPVYDNTGCLLCWLELRPRFFADSEVWLMTDVTDRLSLEANFNLVFEYSSVSTARPHQACRLPDDKGPSSHSICKLQAAITMIKGKVYQDTMW